MPEREVPKGSRVIFKVDGEEMPELKGIQLRIEEDIALSLSSNFDPMFSRGVSNAEKLVSDVAGAIVGDAASAFSSQHQEFGFQVWRSTAPLKFSLSLTIRMKTDAYNDVIKPTQALISMAVPNKPGSGGGLKMPGPSIVDVLNPGGSNKDPNAITVSCSVGWMNFNNVLVRQAEPIFSRHTDSNGYSIWSKVKLDIESVFIASRQMIDEMTNGVG